MIFLNVVMFLLCYMGKYLKAFGRTGRKFDPVVIFNDKILFFCREQVLRPLFSDIFTAFKLLHLCCGIVFMGYGFIFHPGFSGGGKE